jgi:hypothetical protein
VSSPPPTWTPRALAASLPTRARIAEALGWRRPDGQTKAMSARVALNRMAADGLVVLPPPRNTNGNGRIPRYHDPAQPGLFDPDPAPTGPLTTTLAALGPLHPLPGQHPRQERLLPPPTTTSATPLPGAQLRYLVHTTSRGVAAALGFAASAWNCAARDTHIGWDTPTRQAHLHLVVGNARFLIPPHLRVPHLASTALAATTRRLATDWHTAYRYTPSWTKPSSKPPASPAPATEPPTGPTSEPPPDAASSTATTPTPYPSKTSTSTPLHRAWRAILTTTP